MELPKDDGIWRLTLTVRIRHLQCNHAVPLQAYQPRLRSHPSTNLRNPMPLSPSPGVNSSSAELLPGGSMQLRRAAPSVVPIAYAGLGIHALPFTFRPNELEARDGQG